MARRGSRYVAGSLCLRGEDALYGRHWGCSEHIPSLHFELCYYATIEHAIANGLKRFEAGAQGEHKVGRGFVPVTTWSTHWIRHPAFRNAIDEFLRRERTEVDRYMASMAEHSPYKPSVDAA